MKFFIPFVAGEAETQQAYAALKQSVAGGQGEIFSERKIHSIRYKHNGRKYYARVGRMHAANQEIVLAILYDPLRDLYLVCTPNRAARNGGPILVGGPSVTAVVGFDA